MFEFSGVLIVENEDGGYSELDAKKEKKSKSYKVVKN